MPQERHTAPQNTDAPIIEIQRERPEEETRSPPAQQQGKRLVIARAQVENTGRQGTAPTAREAEILDFFGI